MKIEIFQRQEDLPILSESVLPLVMEVLKLEKITTDGLYIHFVSQEEISHLHELYFDDPSPTDCISFPIDAQEHSFGPHLLGEIFIAPRAALCFSPLDPYRECSLYLVHGILHLIGYDDLEKEKRQEMRKAEKRIMKELVTKGVLLSS